MSRFPDTCLIIGNGKSLSQIPRSLLDHYPSFGSNEIFLLWNSQERSPEQLRGFVVDVFCCVNPLVISQNRKAIEEYPAERKYIDLAAWDKTAFPDWAIPLYSYPSPVFSRDLERGIYQGFSVTFVLLQIAYHLGIRTALLVGIDHRYTFNGNPNAENVDVHPEANHFHPDYFRGKKWHNPDLPRSEAAYRMARTAFEQDGRRIVNLTPDSALDVFEKEDFSLWTPETNSGKVEAK